MMSKFRLMELWMFEFRVLTSYLTSLFAALYINDARAKKASKASKFLA